MNLEFEEILDTSAVDDRLKITQIKLTQIFLKTIMIYDAPHESEGH